MKVNSQCETFSDMRTTLGIIILTTTISMLLLTSNYFIIHCLVSEDEPKRKRNVVIPASTPETVCDKSKEIIYRASYPKDPRYERRVIKNAVQRGAVCLDGSPAVYYDRKGRDEGRNKWIVYLQGGAWCSTKGSCLMRLETHLGSSKYYPPIQSNTAGILADNDQTNPYFCKWRVVFVQYCDGASFIANRSRPMRLNERLVFSRGRQIFASLLEDLLELKLIHAEQIILAGSSSGGLAVLLHMENFRSRISSKVPVFFLVDGAFFFDVPCSLNGEHLMRERLRQMLTFHSVKHTETLPGPLKTGFLQNIENKSTSVFISAIASYLQSQTMLVNSLYDSYQLVRNYGVMCAYEPEKCPLESVPKFETFRSLTDEAINTFLKENLRLNYFFHSCIVHVNIIDDNLWNGKLTILNMTISDAFKSILDATTVRLINNNEHEICS